MAIRLRDVAEKAGVTPVVVSRVLHNKANGIRVSEATAQRIRDAAEDLGYRVNVWARNFRNQRTMALGVLHGTGFPRPMLDRGSRYFASLMDGIIEGAFKHGYSVTMCPKLLGEDSNDAMNDGRFDGLIWYSTSPPPEMKEQIIRSVVPIVVLHAHTAEFGGRIPTVICDNYQGIKLAVDHLASLGHRKISFAMERELLSNEVHERRDAFLKTSEQAGLPVTSADVIQLDWERRDLHTYLLNPLHSAVICFSDGLAADFIAIAQEHGLTIPKDLSVIGFDSTAFCNELRPELTSISQPLLRIGETAIDVLVKRIEGEMVEPMESVLPCTLDIRRSTESVLQS
ncbi:MAG: LacI family DNA-binding transcriptional regulator [Chlorobia bacterium]|nr:LacI family DNA-binding transcriptional regulator [Fimbriimonadaceae bacterium]